MATPPDVDPIRPGANPQLSLSGAGIACRPDQQPVWTQMTGAITRWLRYHFSDATRIEFPVLVGRIWNADPELSQIKITSLAEWTPLAADQRPALLIDRLDQDVDPSKQGIGKTMMGGPAGRFSHIVVGSHVVHCIGGREGEAEYLAAEVWREMTRFAPVVRSELGLLRIQVPKLGRRAQVADGDGKPHYTVPVQVTYGYEESWKITTPDQPEITAIIFGGSS